METVAVLPSTERGGLEVHKKVLSLLDAELIPYTIHRHEPIRTIHEANQKVPHLTRNLLKTIVFRVSDGDDRWILATVPGAARVDYKKLAEAFGVKRTDLRSVSPEEVEAELGFEVGGVGPFPIRDDVLVVMDTSLLELDSVFCGSGINTRTVEIQISHLARLARARGHPIVKV